MARAPSTAADDFLATDQTLPLADGEVKVRFYRIGHGDCFLLAFPRKPSFVVAGNPQPLRPVFVLIDCGSKGGSAKPLGAENKARADAIVADIRTVTGGRIDVAVISHEHEDHVSGITAERFEDFTFGAVWLAWTEDPTDLVAQALAGRKKARKRALAAAVKALGQVAGGMAAGDSRKGEVEARQRRLEEMLALEDNIGEGGDWIGEAPGGVTSAGGGGANRRAMDVWRSKVAKPDYHRPHDKVLDLPNTHGVKAYVLGPYRDPDAAKMMTILKDEDAATGSPEEFNLGGAPYRSYAWFLGEALEARAAAGSRPPGPTDAESNGTTLSRPFGNRAGMTLAEAASDDFFRMHYGFSGDPEQSTRVLVDEGSLRIVVAPDNAGWRRIDDDWLAAADDLAIKLDDGVNNTSLVLAFEIGDGGKVLLFPGDAQRGNWMKWNAGHWTVRDGLTERKVEAKELLSRTVLLKVAHHGSHNGTYNGKENDPYPNLSWLGSSPTVQEFTALVPAVPQWAFKKAKPIWVHPLPAIKRALIRKTGGRLLQTDTALPENGDVVARAAALKAALLKGTGEGNGEGREDAVDPSVRVDDAILKRFLDTKEEGVTRVSADPGGLWFDITIPVPKHGPPGSPLPPRARKTRRVAPAGS